VLGANAMREADRTTIEDLGIPGFTLMESAGRRSADIIRIHWPEARAAVIWCGKGNNGGDGLVVARSLLDAGWSIQVVLVSGREDLSTDCKMNLSVLEHMQANGLIPNLSITSDLEATAPDTDVHIDALFGTGLSSALRPPAASVVEQINDQDAPIIALDVPSGLNADTGGVDGVCVIADMTICMGAAKTGLFVGQGPEYAGDIVLADIGIPATLLRRYAGHEHSAWASTDDWVSARLQPRKRGDHKFTTGPALIVGGSENYPGAPVLSARAAARVGSGYVVACGPDSIRGLLAEKLDEIPVESWNVSDGPESTKEHLDTMMARLDTRWSKAKGLLIGPGMGRTADIPIALSHLLSNSTSPVVIDADGLVALATLWSDGWAAWQGFAARCVLTPHNGEMRRLVDTLKLELPLSRVEAARLVAKASGAVILWKGQPSLCASPDGTVVINQSGNASVGTAGTGDVLAGLVTGLMAQGLSPMEAAVAGIHIGGTAADRFVEAGASQSLVASDIIDALPAVLRALS